MKGYKLLIIAFILLLLNLSQCSLNNTLREDLKSHTELVEALNDSVRITTDKLGRETAEKKVLRTSVETLEAQVNNLSDNQKTLLIELKQAKKQGTPKAGVVIQEKVVLRDVVIIKNDTITVIDSLSLDNEKTITLIEVKRGTIVQIKNSNPVFHTVNVDALLVPEKRYWYNSKAFKAGLFITGFVTGVFISR